MLSTWLVGLIYVLAFSALVIGLFFWRRRQRRDRRPFQENLKLLRGPGETLRQRLAKLDENLMEQMFFAMAVPPLVGATLLWITTHLSGAAQGMGLLISLVASLAVMLLAARYLVGQINRSSNCYLGLFGERMVAEALEPLKAQGFRVFHDVPASGASAAFNIDHVIVGPSGVFAIETKTRRKGRARGGFAEHEIIYDGQVLAYPWGEDRHGLEQAGRQARWLAEWLGQRLGERPPVTAILTFPGWMIIRRGAGTVVVLNPKEIPAALQPRGPAVLRSEQIDLIARQLDAACRDVAY